MGGTNILGIIDLVYLALLFDNEEFIKKYIKSVKIGKIINPCYRIITRTDLNVPTLDNHLFILIKSIDKDPCINEFISVCKRNKHFVNTKTVYIKKVAHYLFTFDIPFNYARDLRLIEDGKYSQIAISTKEHILHYWGLQHTSNLYKILYKIKGAVNTKGIALSENDIGEYYNKQNDPIPIES